MVTLESKTKDMAEILKMLEPKLEVKTEDGYEGVRYQNVFGTYSHGPVLPKNPAFCDHLLTTALQKRYPNLELQPLDDAAELAAHNTMRDRLLKK